MTHLQPHPPRDDSAADPPYTATPPVVRCPACHGPVVLTRDGTCWCGLCRWWSVVDEISHSPILPHPRALPSTPGGPR